MCKLIINNAIKYAKNMHILKQNMQKNKEPLCTLHNILKICNKYAKRHANNMQKICSLCEGLYCA